MDFIELLVNALAWGAAISSDPSVTPSIRDHYTHLGTLLQARYEEVNLALLEADPHSRGRRVVLDEDLRKTTVAQDAEVLELAQSLMSEIQALGSDVPQVCGVRIEDVVAASLALRDIAVRGAGDVVAVDVARTRVAGPISVTEVQAGDGSSQASSPSPAGPRARSGALPAVSLTDVDAEGRIEIEVAETIFKQQIIYPDLAEQLLATRVKLEAILYTEPRIREKYCRAFFGREDLARDVAARLETHREVLLCGLGGSGKTVLAAAIGDAAIRAGNGPVLWLHCGDESADTLFEAFVRLACDRGQPERALQFRQLQGEARAQALAEFLTHDVCAGLVILDDTRNAPALRALLTGIPEDLPTLITSRRRIPVDEVVDVGDLSPPPALQLLSYHADRDLSHDPAAAELCKCLSYHAYALEIAGCRLKVDGDPPHKLWQRLVRAPHVATMPEGFAEPGRESVKALLDDSYQRLDDCAQTILLAFGALFAPGATAEFLAAYTQCELEAVEDALRTLARRSLARRQNQSSFYVLHDLTFSYVRALREDAGLHVEAVVAGVRAYLERHARDHTLLDLDEPNLLGAARIAAGETLVAIMACLVIGGYPQPDLPSFFDRHGHTQELLERLDAAIEALQQLDPDNRQTLHYLLGKRGNAEFDRGDFDGAFAFYEAAGQAAPNPNREALVWGAMGRARAAQARYDDAEACFEHGYEIAQAHGDDHALAYVLEQRAAAAGWGGDYEAARRFAREAVVVSQRIGDPEALGFAWQNLGSAELDLGTDKALAYHRRALDIAEREEIEELRALALQSLGEDLLAQRAFEQACDYLSQALALYQAMGKTEVASTVQETLNRFGYKDAQ